MNSEWISVRERVPDAYTEVLAVWHYKNGPSSIMRMYTITCCDKNGGFVNVGDGVEITHWRELPELPGEEK